MILYLGFVHSSSSCSSTKLLTEQWGRDLVLLGTYGWETAFCSLIHCTSFSVFLYFLVPNKAECWTQIKWETIPRSTSFQQKQTTSNEGNREEEVCLSFWAKPEIEREAAALEIYMQLHCFVGKTLQLIIPRFVSAGIFEYWCLWINCSLWKCSVLSLCYKWYWFVFALEVWSSLFEILCG